MGKKGLPQGIRKFIRREKARIRRETNSPEEEKRRIEELLNKFTVKHGETQPKQCRKAVLLRGKEMRR